MPAQSWPCHPSWFWFPAARHRPKRHVNISMPWFNLWLNRPNIRVKCCDAGDGVTCVAVDDLLNRHAEFHLVATI